MTSPKTMLDSIFGPILAQEREREIISTSTEGQSWLMTLYHQLTTLDRNHAASGNELKTPDKPMLDNIIAADQVVEEKAVGNRTHLTAANLSLNKLKRLDSLYHGGMGIWSNPTVRARYTVYTNLFYVELYNLAKQIRSLCKQISPSTPDEEFPEEIPKIRPSSRGFQQAINTTRDHLNCYEGTMNSQLVHNHEHIFHALDTPDAPFSQQYLDFAWECAHIFDLMSVLLRTVAEVLTRQYNSISGVLVVDAPVIAPTAVSVDQPIRQQITQSIVGQFTLEHPTIEQSNSKLPTIEQSTTEQTSVESPVSDSDSHSTHPRSGYIPLSPIDTSTPPQPTYYPLSPATALLPVQNTHPTTSQTVEAPVSQIQDVLEEQQDTAAADNFGA